jgi:hypothetical protein
VAQAGFTGLDSFGNTIDNASAGGDAGIGAGDSGADGTAGEGRPFANAAITITDAAGRVASATSNASGYYRAKVTGFTAPLVAKATLGAKEYYSVGISNPATNTFITLNLTGLTDKIASDVAVAAGKTSSAQITPALVNANLAALNTAKANLRTQLTTQLTANGLNATTFDPVTLPFRTNGTGYDAVLDTTLVTRNSTGSTVITPNGQVLVAGLDTSGIATLVSQFNILARTGAGLTSAEFGALISADYFDAGDTKASFLLSLPTRFQAPLEWRNPSFNNCNFTAQTCQAGGSVYENGTIRRDFSTQPMLLKLTASQWQLYGNREPVNVEFTPVAQRSYNYSATTAGVVSSDQFGFLAYMRIGKFKSGTIQYYGTTAATPTSPITLVSMTTKAACTGTNTPIDDGNASNCGDVVLKTDAQMNTLSADMLGKSVTLKITVYESAGYTGTPTVFTRPFTQTLLTNSSASVSYASVTNPLGFQTGSINFTSPAVVSQVSIRVSKRLSPTVVSQTGFTYWTGSDLPALAGNVSLAKAEADCGNCGSYSGAGNPQITNLSIDGRDVQDRLIITNFNYPYIY